jgi:hypothetical protein
MAEPTQPKLKLPHKGVVAFAPPPKNPHPLRPGPRRPLRPRNKLSHRRPSPEGLHRRHHPNPRHLGPAQKRRVGLSGIHQTTLDD